ncbi:hypothetical protein MRB53_036926 [Persea americana]|nr:hypothetical protein MRB53_036926 [Persea americana]
MSRAREEWQSLSRPSHDLWCLNSPCDSGKLNAKGTRTSALAHGGHGTFSSDARLLLGQDDLSPYQWRLQAAHHSQPCARVLRLIRRARALAGCIRTGVDCHRHSPTSEIPSLSSSCQPSSAQVVAEHGADDHKLGIAAHREYHRHDRCLCEIPYLALAAMPRARPSIVPVARAIFRKSGRGSCILSCHSSKARGCTCSMICGGYRAED